MATFHPDGKFELVGAEALTAAVGTAQGNEAIRATLAGLIASFEVVQRDFVTFVIDGERAAVHSRVKLRVRSQGQNCHDRPSGPVEVREWQSR